LSFCIKFPNPLALGAFMSAFKTFYQKDSKGIPALLYIRFDDV
jgi:hypothetical protein